MELSNPRAAAFLLRTWLGTVLRWLTLTPTSTLPRSTVFQKPQASWQARGGAWSQTVAAPAWLGWVLTSWKPGRAWIPGHDRKALRFGHLWTSPSALAFGTKPPSLGFNCSNW